MADFKVRGPYPVRCDKRIAGRVVIKERFWESHPELSSIEDKCGVYVFAIKPPRTEIFTPCYVGQAKKNFTQEVFTNDKLLKYNLALADYKSGAPKLFFLIHPNTKKNIKQIEELEDYLIMMGFAVNPNIQNDKGAKLPEWAISGVVRGAAKKPSKTAKHLARMFEIKSRKGV